MEVDETTRNICSLPTMGTYLLWLSVAVSIFFGITSVLSNAVILAALHQESSLHPPSKILLRSLALSDLCVGLILEPIFATLLITKEFQKLTACYQIHAITIFTAEVLCLVSLLTLTAISVDRLLALLLGMRYRQVVTAKRVLLIVIGFWVLDIGFGSVVFWNKTFTLYYIFIVVLLSIIVSTCNYTKIHRKLLEHQAQIQENNDHDQGQPNGHEPLNVMRYRKTLSTAMWVQFALIACYLPMGLVTAIMATRGMTQYLLLAWTLSSMLVFFNSTLNPILYCWKITEVRRAVSQISRQILCYLSS